MRRRTPVAIVATLTLAGLATACLGDDPVRPAGVVGPQGLFANYVSMGGTVTAGYQSAGINDSTQSLAYPALLAGIVGAHFAVPAIRPPGCPPPLRDAYSGTTIDESVSCSLRDRPLPATISNVAVPGAGVYDAISNDGTRSRPLFATTLILGGRTQIEAMAAARPSLVSVRFGDADVQTGGLFGIPAALIDLDDFAQAYDSIVAAVAAAAPVDAVLLGVVPASRSPAVLPAPFFWAHQESGFSSKVHDDCSPGSQYADNDVSLFALLDPALDTLSCADGAPYVASPAERDAMRDRIDALNQYIADSAEQHGWLYLDVDSVFADSYAQPERFRKCQGFAVATTPQQFLDAFLASCPVPGNPDLYGAFVSYDGINPSTLYHEALAEALFDLLSTRYPLRRH